MPGIAATASIAATPIFYPSTGLLKSYGGLQYGVDLRWSTPVKGLLVGASRMNEDITGTGSAITLPNPGAGGLPYPGTSPYSEHSKADWTNQFYGRYTLGKLRIDSEYRRYLRDQIIYSGALKNVTDVRGCYVSGAYRVMKRLALGSYYSRYTITNISGGHPGGGGSPPTDTSLPGNHIYDKVVTARVDFNKFWNLKVEGHFMNGYGASTYPDGFYLQVNPQGFQPNTNALVIKTGINF